MAFLGVRVPHEIARLLAGLEVPGDREPPGHMHITLLHFGDDIPVEQIAKALPAIFEVVVNTKPLLAKTNLVSCFDSGESEVYPIICRIESAELHVLWERVKAACDAVGVTYSKKYPEYIPHVTLSYSKEKMTDQLISPVMWTVSELVLWGGDSGDEKLTITFPFALTLSKAAMYRAFVRLACSKPSAEGSSGGCTCGGQCSCQAQRVAARFDRERRQASR